MSPQTPPMALQLLCDQAVAAHQRGDVAAAERLCRQVLAAQPANFTARYLLALGSFQQGRHGEALLAIDAALKANPAAVEAHVVRGLVLHAAGRPAQALASFDRALALAPDFIDALTNRAIVLLQLNRLEDAKASYDKVLALQPGHAGALYNRGVILAGLGRPQDALASFDQALAIRPDLVEGWNNRGLALQHLRRPDEALANFDKALALKPDHAAAWNNRGVALGDLDRPAEALASFDKALSIGPDVADAWNNRGFLLQRLQRLPEALASYDKALALAPDYPEALLNRASALCESDRIADGFAVFTRHAELAHGADSAPPSPDKTPLHKLRHDREQRDYIAGGKPRGGGKKAAPLPLRLVDGGRVAGPAINPANAAEDIAREWGSARPQVVVIDNLLSDEALAKLRRFCWGSTVWRGAYEDGYLGAMADHGFASPLLAQIAEELRAAHPAILGVHPLKYLWAFKYDSQLTGIRVHADQAAVNVNFWITPDEANLDPQSGGLVVWDVAAPLEWDFDAYNADPVAIRAFLERSGARPTTIPYRANRAVIFDSDLFHETDTIAFKEGYLNRRINVTMLYGRRTFDNR
jgi:tetratricopeptide (TPR) repeat protein